MLVADYFVNPEQIESERSIIQFLLMRVAKYKIKLKIIYNETNY